MKRRVRIMRSTATALGATACLAHGGLSQWTIVASYPLPEGASGLAWDGENLYCGIYGANGGQIYKIDPETALRSANAKFERRFRRIEALLAAENRRPDDADLEDLEALWNQTKAEERA